MAAEPTLDDCLHGIAELKTQNNLILRLLNGEPDQDIQGIRPRLKAVEDELRELKTKWNTLEQRYIGAKWVLGALGITTGALGAAVVRLLWGIQ